MPVSYSLRIGVEQDVVGAGFGIPAGSLSAYRSALEDHGSQRVEVLVMGDSTTYGETFSGAGNERPWTARLRELFKAAAVTDGGLGVVNGDGAQFSGPDNVDTITSSTLTGASTYSMGILGTSTKRGSALNEQLTFQGKGTQARLWVVGFGSIDTAVAVQVDGGAETTYEPDQPESGAFNNCWTFSLGSEGTHTVRCRLAENGDGLFALEFLRPNGLVIQNHGIQGITAASYLHGSAWPGGTLDANTDPRARAAYGITRTTGTQPAYNATKDAAPDARDLCLAIIHLGINDQQSSVSQAHYEGALRTHIALARAVGADPLVVIPHFEAAANNSNAATFRATCAAVIADEDVAWCDFGSGGALGASANWVSNGYASAMTNPHLSAGAYNLQAEFLFENVLGRTLPAVAPANTVAPAISGTAETGETLTCSTGTWTGYPTPSYGYQWKRNGTNIGGATSSTYLLQVADEGQSVKCTVTATNTGGSVSADSNTVTPSAPAGGFDPTSITDLAAWYDAGQISGVTTDGAAVSSWTDLSGNGRHATQATGSAQPTLELSEINGEPVVRFTPQQTKWLGTAAFTLNQPYTVIAVYKPINHPTGANRAIVGARGSFSGLMHTTGGVVAVNAGTQLAGTYFFALGTPRILRGVFNGASSSIAVDAGFTAGGASGNAGSNAFGGVAIGGWNNSLNSPDGDIAEIIVYSRVLTSGELADLEGYLSTKYNIAIS